MTDNDIDLKGYRISIVTGLDKDTELYTFPAPTIDLATTIRAKGVLLLVASDPYDNEDHPISVEYNVDLNKEDQVRGLGDTPARYKVTPFLGNGLPDNGNFVLILRKSQDGKGKPSDTGSAHLDKIVDIAGYHSNLKKDPYVNEVSKTDLWPLRGFGAPNFGNNRLEENKVHYRRHVTTNKDGRNGVGAWDNNGGNTAWTDASFTGIGYKRGVSRTAALGGDPGYHQILKNEYNPQTDKHKVVISEMMLSQGPDNRRLPQWIELHNTSKTEAVNLASGWKLIIELPSTREIIGGFRTIDFSKRGTVKVIEPNESVLIVSARARSYGSSTHLRSSIIFPATRVYNVFKEQGKEFDMEGPLDPMLPLAGFHMKLVDGKGNLSDEVGNLDGHERTIDIPEWNYPGDVTSDGFRSSLIRIYDAPGMPREGKSIATSNVRPLKNALKDMKDAAADTAADAADTAADAADATDTAMDKESPFNDPRGIDPKYSWIHAADTEFKISIFTHSTWWGSENDYGTPIQRAGAVLPVQLSSFRPTLEDGKVVIRWTTQSELDNAGFNIYRSETRDGEFKQVNAKLIEGAGTTGERTVYKWVDTSAKPGVVYYYQIEDVSFAGERQTLAVNRLKGYITAKDKLTTRWGELKTLQ